MKIAQIVTGMLQENTYVLNEDEHAALVIDPGDDAPSVIGFLRKQNLEPKLILLTHAHADHIGALDALRAAYPQAALYMHEGDTALLESTVPQTHVDRFFKGDETFHVSGLDIRVLPTPGHTKGGCCYLINGALFSGDTLFEGTIGRTDFPESNWNDMQESLLLLRSLPEDTPVYPGHGNSTTIGREKATNPWMR